MKEKFVVKTQNRDRSRARARERKPAVRDQLILNSGEGVR